LKIFDPYLTEFERRRPKKSFSDLLAKIPYKAYLLFKIVTGSLEINYLCYRKKDTQDRIRS